MKSLRDFYFMRANARLLLSKRNESGTPSGVPQQHLMHF